MDEGKVTDLTRGIYRRIYSGFPMGKRINEVSIEAEAWFWRFHTMVDDFGSAPADPDSLFRGTAGRRQKVTCENVISWFNECWSTGLLSVYEIDGERFFHIVKFEELQPAGKNGRRVQRYPFYQKQYEILPNVFNPGESKIIRVNPRKNDLSLEKQRRCDVSGESGGILNNPGESGCVQSQHSDNQLHKHSDNHNQEEILPPVGGAASGNGEADELEPSRKAACAAMDEWSSCALNVGRGYGIMAMNNEERKVRDFVDRMAEELQPIIRGKEAIPRHLMIPLAVEQLKKGGKEFKSIAYALKTLEGKLNEMVTKGISVGSANGKPQERPKPLTGVVMGADI